MLNAVVETKPGTECYGIMDVYADRLELRGTGDMVSAVMHARLQESMEYGQSSQSTDAQQNGSATSDELEIIRQTG